jgi:hypothetical protein
MRIVIAAALAAVTTMLILWITLVVAAVAFIIEHLFAVAVVAAIAVAVVELARVRRRPRRPPVLAHRPHAVLLHPTPRAAPSVRRGDRGALRAGVAHRTLPPSQPRRP